MSEQEPNAPTPSEGTQHTPQPSPVFESRGWMLRAGDWLQRAPGKRMGLITTLIVLAIMFLLVLLGGG